MSHVRSSIDSKSVLWNAFKLGFPVAIQSALVAILALADVLMVSSHGQAATAAVGLASKWHFVVTMIMAGMANANGVLVAQYWGRKNTEKSKQVTQFSITAGLVILTPIAIALTGGANFIMLLQTKDPSVIAFGIDYLWFAAPSLLLTHFIIVIESSLRSSGDSLTPLLVAALTIGCNIVLNYALIDGHFGLPEMGVAGAALATSLSRLIQVLIYVASLKIRQHWLYTTKAEKADKKLRTSYLQLAAPTAAGAVLWATGTLIYQVIFGHMGTTELAIFSTIAPFESLCYSVFLGISVACSIILGQHLGRNEFEQALRTSQLFIQLIIILGLTTSVALYIGKSELVSLLRLDQDDTRMMASLALNVTCLGVCVKMMNMVVINGILRAGGENHYCLKMDFTSTWLFGLPLTAIGAVIFSLPFHFVYLCMLGEEVVKVFLCLRRYRKHRWLTNLTIS